MKNTQIGKRENLWLPFDALAAPTCNQASELWFEKSEKDASDIFYDIDFYKAFVFKVINKQICPIIPDWVSFAVAGSVVSVLADRLIIPRPHKRYSFEFFEFKDVELHIWEALWYSSKENNGKLSDELLGFILRLFLPRGRDKMSLPPRAIVSNFRYWWDFNYDFVDIGKIRLSFSGIENEIFEKLPQDFKSGIDKIAERTPTMLKIVLEYIT